MKRLSKMSNMRMFVSSNKTNKMSVCVCVCVFARVCLLREWKGRKNAECIVFSFLPLSVLLFLSLSRFLLFLSFLFCCTLAIGRIFSSIERKRDIFIQQKHRKDNATAYQPTRPIQPSSSPSSSSPFVEKENEEKKKKRERIRP